MMELHGEREAAILVFAYGSLMWREGFAPTSRQPAVARGWRRAWCVPSTVHRGTPERPGVVLGLVPGGACLGEVLEVPAAGRAEVLAALEARELCEGGYLIGNVEVETASGPASAVCFATPGLPGIDEAAAMAAILAACGSSGTNLEYAVRTLERLAAVAWPDGWDAPCPGMSQAAAGRILAQFAPCGPGSAATARGR